MFASGMTMVISGSVIGIVLSLVLARFLTGPDNRVRPGRSSDTIRAIGLSSDIDAPGSDTIERRGAEPEGRGGPESM